MTDTSIKYVRKPAPTRNALKLGGKSKDVDSFVDQLKSEGQNVTNLAPTNISSASAPAARAKANVATDEYAIQNQIEIHMNSD